MTQHEAADLEKIRSQIHQSLVEHEIVAQALRAQAIVSALFILALGSLCFFLWRRHGYLNQAFHLEIRRHSVERAALVNRHSNERVQMVKDQSLQLASVQMQMLHAFEQLVSRKPGGSVVSIEARTSKRPPPIPDDQ